MRAMVLLAVSTLLTAACAEEDANGAAASPRAGGDSASRSGASATSGRSDAAGEACSGTRSRSVAFTGDEQSDTVAIRVDAEHCAEAAALVTVRDSDGVLLFAEAFRLESLALREAPSPARLEDLLASFTGNISLRPASDLDPFEAATTEGPDNPVAIRPVATQAIYERAREVGGSVLCFNIHYETAQCLWRDPERGGTFHLYYSGP